VASFEKKKKRDIAKVRVEPKRNDVPDVKHNCYATSSTPMAWKTDLFIRLASYHEIESSTDGTIAPADLLLPVYWQYNSYYL